MVVWSGGEAYADNVAIFDTKEKALHHARCLNELDRSGAAPHLRWLSVADNPADQKV